MTSWQVGESSAAIELDDRGRGTVTFTVTNPGPDQDRAVLSVTPLDGAVREWFVVEDPQRTISGGDSAVYVVKIEAPEGTAEGTYAFQGVVYSADRDPAESSTTSRRIAFEVAPKGPSTSPWWVLAVVAGLVLLIGAVVVLIRDDGPPSPPPETDQPETEEPETDQPETDQPETEEPETEEPETDQPETDPNGPDLQFSRLFECSVVPRGAVSGADNLTLFIQLRNAGPGSVDQAVPMLVESDSGLRSTPTTSVGTGAAFNPIGIDVVPADYEQAHRFTIVADPNNEIVESDESNNTLRITVDLPERPSSAAEVPCSLS